MQVSILRAHLNALRQDKDRTSTLQNRMQRLGVDVYLLPTCRLTKEQLAKVQTDLQKAAKDSMNIQHQELDKKIIASRALGQGQKAKFLSSIQKVEIGRATY